MVTMHQMAVRVLAVLMLFVTPAMSAGFAAAQGAPAAGAPPPVAQQKAPAGGEQKTQERKAPAPPAPTAIPVPEIVRRAEEAAKLLRDLEALAAPSAAIDAIQARLPEVSARLGPEIESTIETLKESPPGTIVDRLQQSWRASRLELVANVEVLTKRATQLEGALDQLAGLRARWTQTRADARASRAPAAVLQRVDAVLADIEATRARLQAQRAATLVLQDRVAQEVERCEDALARIDRHRQGEWTRLFVRTTPPIWSLEVRERHLAELPARAHEAAVASLAQIRQFVSDNAVGLLLQGLVFIGLAIMARGARRRARGLAAAGEEAPPAAALFDRPYSSAAVAALALTLWMFPGRPRVVTDAIGALMLLPMLRVVGPVVGPALAPALYALGALCLFDRIRANLAVVPLADQALMLLDMLAAVAGLAWLLGSGRLRRAPAGEPMAPEVPPARRATAVFVLAVFAGSFAAAAYGAMDLARKFGATLLISIFVAIMSYAAVRVVDGLLAFALRVWPLRRLGMVEGHRYLLERRGHRLLCWIMAAAWAVSSLRLLGAWDGVVDLAQAALAAELRQGTIGISLGDVLAFALTVWLAFLLSAGIRFVLEEDVYPRLHLARGLPYVVSSLLHYAILFLGFLLAVGALGVDLNKLTVLTGAFGVGLGFGLRDVVNNFVSGLIVLFERPIRQGDAIQMGDLAGEVRRIGIRATTVRNWEGAEVIVPNASLVAEKVTNWTHSDRLRRMDVPVGVAYGSAPEKVLELLLAVARAHPGVLAEPAPQALFLGFGESALNFELRAWTSRFSQWVVFRSELGVGVYAALRHAQIEIPVPQREVRLREGGGAAVGSRAEGAR
ncbi:MAG TPA: mechanosensitive ion channel domain-containing protein [Candidatus Methylomirabilis sp.]